MVFGLVAELCLVDCRQLVDDERVDHDSSAPNDRLDVSRAGTVSGVSLARHTPS